MGSFTETLAALLAFDWIAGERQPHFDANAHLERFKRSFPLAPCWLCGDALWFDWEALTAKHRGTDSAFSGDPRPHRAMTQSARDELYAEARAEERAEIIRERDSHIVDVRHGPRPK